MECTSSFAKLLSYINKKVGQWSSWLALLMAFLAFVVVVLRYVFHISWVWLQDTILYMHALLFLTTAAWALQADEHVRVDIVYRGLGEKKKRIINKAGVVLFLWPFCILLLIKAWPFINQSWAVFEGSPTTGALPLIFILKSFIAVFAVQLLLQGLALLLDSNSKK